MARGTKKKGRTESDLARLIESIRAVEGTVGREGPSQPAGGNDHETPGRVCTGWEPVDRFLGSGLVRGAIHEWFAVDADADVDVPARASDRVRRGAWVPPLSLLVHVAQQAMASGDAGDAGDAGANRRVVWVGRRVWPYPPALAGLLRDAIFVDPGAETGHWWSVDLALRSGVFAAVIADGAGLRMAESRRLQLAATAGETLGLLVRPAWERKELSVAATRWHVTRVPDATQGAGPRWSLKLVRCKGRQSTGPQGGDLPRAWMVEQDRDEGVVRVSAVVGRPQVDRRSA